EPGVDLQAYVERLTRVAASGRQRGGALHSVDGDRDLDPIHQCQEPPDLLLPNDLVGQEDIVQHTSVGERFGLTQLGTGEADSPRLALHPGDFGRLVRLQVRAHRHTVLAGKGRHLLDVAAQDGLVDNQTRRVEFVAVPHRLPPPSPDHTGHFFPLVSIQRCNSWLRCTESSTSCTFMPSSNDGTALLPSRIPRTHSRASSTNGRTRRSAKFGRSPQTSGSSISDKT